MSLCLFWVEFDGLSVFDNGVVELILLIQGQAEVAANQCDFGVEFDDTPYKLLVADITNEEWEMVKRDQSLLPAGWRLDDARRWGGRK